MDHPVARTTGKGSRFELAPPRRFVLPAVLLLLSERPGYGYELEARLEEFHFGHVDRPAVYRALGQLEADGLAQASSESGTVGQARRVYRLTSLGQRTLRVWMGVIKEEHDYLGQVLRRYQATGTADAVLAEVEGGWASALSSGWSPVSSTLAGHRRLAPVDLGTADLGTADLGTADLGTVGADPTPGKAGALAYFEPGDGDAGDGGTVETDGNGAASPSANAIGTPALRDFQLVPERSVLLIEVRSTVGPLSFGAIGVTGSVRAVVVDGTIRANQSPTGHLEVDLSGLSSGNGLYDAELRRRIDARRFPMATVDLRNCKASGPGALYRMEGDLTFHGVSRPAQGTVRVEVGPDDRLIITGEQVFDIREFAIPSPTVLMLRIYPDVRVRIHAEAVAAA
jgi:DNA-binding PadR family transcriptional regulator/polyisoprenoid-binding protein YceI